MIRMVLSLLILGSSTFASDESATELKQNSKDRLLALHLKEAREYSIYRDSENKQKLTLLEDPVYLWTNPLRTQGQSGAVFLWTYRGRPEVLGTFFSHPGMENQRWVHHELHSLSRSVIHPQRKAANQWQPRAGIHFRPVPDAPQPADLSRVRRLQLRNLSRKFRGTSVEPDGKRWELRLLPQPLNRDEITEPKVLECGVLAFVSSAGTDPEVLLILEAIQTSEGPQWQYALARFSDFNLYVRYNDKEIWRSVLDNKNTQGHDARHLYRIYRDKIIPEIVETAP